MAIANALAFLLYISCSVILIYNFVSHRQESQRLLSIGIVTLLALIFHGAAIFFTMRLAGGWDLGLFTTLTIATWLMAFIAFIIGTMKPITHPGIIVYPLVAFSLILKTVLPTENVVTMANPALEWHILLSLAAYSLFTLAALQAIVLAIQEQQLRQRHLAGLLQKLPPLQSMETILFQLIMVGFGLLTIGLLTGIIFIDNIFSQHLVHKTLLSFISWSVFATLLWGRKQYGWRGKTAIKWTLTGFSFLVFAYFGSKFVLEFFLK
ncbi:MAG: cytochrome c biogenesis protein CcsA [Piscirickettsiaceae bacterium]|nr:cytochrome c biogenesis protein CcsA [Piscirickettsiaceae bacterium]